MAPYALAPNWVRNRLSSMYDDVTLCVLLMCC